MAHIQYPISNTKPLSNTKPSWVAVILAASLLLGACGPATAPAQGGAPKVLAVETFLADIAQNVAGDRLTVAALLPVGVDPHSYEVTPADVRKVAESTVLIANGAGFETFLQKLLANAGGQRSVIEASVGLAGRSAREGELVEEEHPEGDPHFWLNPINVIKYVENIRDGLSQADPAGKEIYARNAAAYIVKLKELDGWITEQVKAIPPERRLLVTNHESFGYFADRYGFRVVGTIIPSVSTGASPSAQELARLMDHIKGAGAPAIFLETGANPQMAQQIAKDTGVKVVTELYTHSLTARGGAASDYLAMMRYNTQAIVDALR